MNEMEKICRQRTKNNQANVSKTEATLSPSVISGNAGQQAAADITGPLQFRPMLYTLYIGINIGPLSRRSTED